MRFVRPWYSGLRAKAFPTWLSPSNLTGLVSVLLMLSRKADSYMLSLVASVPARYSASVVLRAIVCCFFEAQEIAH